MTEASFSPQGKLGAKRRTFRAMETGKPLDADDFFWGSSKKEMTEPSLHLKEQTVFALLPAKLRDGSSFLSEKGPAAECRPPTSSAVRELPASIRRFAEYLRAGNSAGLSTFISSNGFWGVHYYHGEGGNYSKFSTLKELTQSKEMNRSWPLQSQPPTPGLFSVQACVKASNFGGMSKKGEQLIAGAGADFTDTTGCLQAFYRDSPSRLMFYLRYDNGWKLAVVQALAEADCTN